MSNIELPAFHYFSVGNGYSGHVSEEIRYKLWVDKEEEIIVIGIWKGPYCFENSERLDTVQFELTEAGFEQAVAWLDALE